jgi:hypothetical protein
MSLNSNITPYLNNEPISYTDSEKKKIENFRYLKNELQKILNELKSEFGDADEIPIGYIIPGNPTDDELERNSRINKRNIRRKKISKIIKMLDIIMLDIIMLDINMGYKIEENAMGSKKKKKKRKPSAKSKRKTKRKSKRKTKRKTKIK